GDMTHLGKRAQKDSTANKATFVSLLGMDGAKAQADILAGQAIDALSPFGDRGKMLAALARFVITRKR
nr:polyprenyl synthetase family protein [Pseudomonadota bacterium]